MKKSIVVILCFVILIGLPKIGLSGTIDSPGDPSAGSGMYTLQDIYDFLLSGTSPVVSGGFQEPISGPGSTMITTSEIYNDIKALFDLSDATPNEVLSSVTFFSTDPGNWGPLQGSIASRTVDNTTVTQLGGIYSGFDLSSVDTDLVSGNIRAGVDIFGVTGNANVVDTTSGDATAGEILIGKVAWVDGSALTGTLATQTLSSGSTTLTAGYYNATTLDVIDVDLVSGNIRAGVSVFGVDGNANVVDTSSGTATAADMLSGSVAWVAGSAVTGTLGTQTLSSGSTTLSAGYYNATTLDAVDVDLISANIKAGATIFGVGGTPYVVDTGSGDAIAGDILSGKVAWVDGSAVTGTVATQTLSSGSTALTAGYYNATTLEAVDADLISANIRAGATIFGVGGTPYVVDTGSGDAIAGDILSGKVAWVDGSAVTGTVATQTLSSGSTTLSVGYYNATTLEAVDADLISANIRSGVSVFGVDGNTDVVNTSSGTATAGDMLNGTVAWVDGSAVTGTIATQTLSSGSTTVSAGYYNATTLDAVDADLISANIKSGITLFGVTGNVFVVDTTSGDATASDVLNGKVAWVDGSVVTGTYPLVPVATSGVTTCYHTSGATIISCTDTGQDGDLQKGVASPNPRFTDNGDGTVTDNLTGLIWIQEADCFSAMTWDSSLSSVNALQSGSCLLTDGSGVSEWRLPNLKELLSLIDYSYSNPALTNASGTTKWTEGDPFSGVTGVNGYWTSTSYLDSPGSAWSVDLVDGGTTSVSKSSSLQAWPVKGGL